MASSSHFLVFLSVLVLVSSHQFGFHDRQHLQAHMPGERRLTRHDLDLLYFKSHDTEANDKLDGCELVQSLLHYHSEESGAHGYLPKVFTDAELSTMVDSLMKIADKNKDGFIDYPEFISG